MMDEEKKEMMKYATEVKKKKKKQGRGTKREQKENKEERYEGGWSMCERGKIKTSNKETIGSMINQKKTNNDDQKKYIENKTR